MTAQQTCNFRPAVKALASIPRVDGRDKEEVCCVALGLRMSIKSVRWLMGLASMALAFMSICAAAAPAAAPSALSDPQRYRIAVSAPGQDPVQLYVEEYGKGRPVLLLHGLGASTYTWRNLIPSLAQKHRVIALDLKGFGRSEKPLDRAYSPRDHTALVAAFIRQRRLQNLTLMGHSLGGAVALLVTLDLNRTDRSRIRDLVLMSPPAYNQTSTEFVNFMQAPVLPYAALALIPPELSIWLSLDSEQARNISSDDIKAYAAPFYDPAAHHALISTARQIVPPDIDRITATYPSIRQRTLIVWCDGDTTVPLATGRQLAEALPNAKLQVLEGCGHAPQHDSPRAVWNLLRRFLN
jgi:pimeloyl-ACP methyl ester carboxylesterase